MKKFTFKSQLALGVSALMLTGMVDIAAFAQDNGDTVTDEIITTGTRRTARTAIDAPAPVDVISGEEFTNQAAADIGDLIRTVVPSYNVNTQPISDAATIIRPANLRGLSPDNTLVLLNGKRRHRGSVISFLGGGISDGAQGVDISVFPSIALKQVEVLRDGASSQYGSDAIAGVMNFKLKDASEGGQVEATIGSTLDGDGDNYRISGNIGLPLGENGFVNLSGEYSSQDGTVRSVVRDDVLGLLNAGYTPVRDFRTINSYTDAVPQYWGQPDVKDNFKIFVNSGIDLTDTMQAYAFGNYAERTAEGGFFFRNPTNRGGVYRGPVINGGPSVLVGDLDGVGVGGACPAGIPLVNGVPDPVVLAQVAADPNCFSFLETIPSGFVPRFGGNNRDLSGVFGVKGELDFGNGLGYDISYSYGTNKTDFFIKNTVNASLGPNTPRDFVPGAYEQIEQGARLDLTYGLPVSGWASDLGIAAGVEWRDEQFDITAGDPQSYALGPLADQGFSSSSNGFGGFSESTSNSQSNIGVYTELEADVTDAFTLQAAWRYEDYDLFGSTTNWKLGGLYKLSDNLRLRATYSTGFHAPTAGQANVKNVTTQNVNGQLIDQGTIPLTSTPGQLAAAFLENQTGVKPDLGPETAKNFSGGLAFSLGSMDWTIDYFNIKVKNRIATSENIDFAQVLQFVANRDNVTLTAGAPIATWITELANAGSIVRSDFTGFEDLTSFKFFTNSFSTKTSGIDIVGKMPFDIGVGSSNVVLALNYTKTDVTDRGVNTAAPIGQNRIRALEDLLPNWKGNLTFNHEQGMWRGLVRVNYFGPWYDTGNGFDVGSEFVVDAEIGAEVMDGVEVIVGMQNLLDNYPDKNPSAGSLGQLYPEASPMGFNGGAYYAKIRYTF